MKSTTQLTLCLTGDVMLGRGVDQLFPTHCSPRLHEPFVTHANDYVSLAEEKNGPILRPVSATYIWGDALQDLADENPHARIINLETSLTTSEDFWLGKSIHYRAHPSQADTLTAAKIDCCVLGNNHTMDWGHLGLEETLHCLATANITATGAGRTPDTAVRPATLRWGERRIKIFSFASITSGVPAPWQVDEKHAGLNVLECFSKSQMIHTIHAHHTANDIVIVSIHWGDNWGYHIDPAQITLAHDLIDESDADIVHFHSSHHPKSIEIYREKLVLYGAGDLINDYEGIRGYEEFHPDLGILYFARIDATSGDLIHLRMRTYVRRLMQLNEAPQEENNWLATTLTQQCRQFSTRVIPTRPNVLDLERLTQQEPAHRH